MGTVADDSPPAELNRAARQGEVQTLASLLEGGGSVDARDAKKLKSRTPLLWACDAGHAEVLQLVLSRRADPDAADLQSETGLMLASRRGDQVMASYLLEARASVSLVDRSHRTALFAAAEAKDESVLRLLMRSHAEVNAADMQKSTPLMVAASRGHLGNACFLLESRADVMARNSKFKTALDIADEQIRAHQESGKADAQTEDLQALLQRLSSAYTSPAHSPFALNAASEAGDIEAVKQLLSTGTSVDALDWVRRLARTPLLWACAAGHAEVLHFLLENKADAGRRELDSYWFTFTGRTALMLASESGCDAAVRVVLQTHADVNETAREDTAFHLASRKGHLVVMHQLLDAGAPINAPIQTGDFVDPGAYTALHAACEAGHAAAAELLLNCKADPLTSTQSRVRPLGSACLRGHVAVVRLLLDRGLDLHARVEPVCTRHGFPHDDFDALMFACYEGHTEVANFLLDRRANVNATHRGYDPGVLHVAIERRKLPVMRLLLDRNAEVEGSDALIWETDASRYTAEAVRLLVERRANVNATGEDFDVGGEKTPLMFAAQNEYVADLEKPAVVQLLLESRADVNYATETGVTALHMACKRATAEVAELMLKAGANVNEATHKGTTCLDFVERNEKEAVRAGIADVLQKWGAKRQKIERRLDLTKVLEPSDSSGTAFSEEDLQHAEAQLGHKLPRLYIELLRVQNGGELVNKVFPLTGQAGGEVEVEGIMGLQELVRSQAHWLGEWRYPALGIYFANCPSAGHDLVGLDYRGGSETEPAVVHVSQESGYKITTLATSFEGFLLGLE